MADKIEIEILEDGEIKITTPGISAANHCSADQLLGEIAKAAGGQRQTKKQRAGHAHVVAGKTIYHNH